MNTGTAPDAVRRHRLKRWVSADAISLVNSMLRRGVVYRGNYATWEDAASHAAGYDSQAILERVVAATTAVRDGKAMAERDGIVLAKLDFPFPLIAALMRSAALNGGNLSVLDFGGGLVRRTINATRGSRG